MHPVEEMHELERLWRESPYSVEFLQLRLNSKWGERIREEVIAGIRSSEPEAIDDGTLYLETNPWYHRSGYHKAIIASALKSAELTFTQQERLRQVILMAVGAGVGPEFKEYARLAIVVANAEFLAQVKGRLNSEEGWVRARLARLASLCAQNPDGADSV